MPASGTWCDRKVPSTGTPSTLPGPVHPLGLRRMTTGQRARSGLRAARMAAMRSKAASRVAAIAWCMLSGSEPSTSSGSYPRPEKNATSSARGIRASTVGLLIL